MSQRPGRSSIFLRDEFSGLLDAMFRKDYMAGMAESLTKLYDGKYQKRILKRETIEVREPVLIMFCGGIKSRTFELLTKDQVISGFLPRFIFILGESDITKTKPIGPPTVVSTRERDNLKARFAELHTHYNQSTTSVIGGQTIVVNKRWNATLTEDAWLLYNQFESTMVNWGLQHAEKDVMMPSLDRLAKSGLKCALLIAASRACTDDIVVTELDLLHAFYYVEQWRQHLIKVLSNLGKSTYEKLIDMVGVAVDAAGTEGVMRGTIMRLYHLSARTADDVIGTAEERGLLISVKSGKSWRLYPPNVVIAS
jgi:hypothetical protein